MKDRIKSLITDQKRVLDIAMLFCIAVFAFFINRDIEIKGLYMDDLYMWSCYGEQKFFEFVFPIGTSSRFRPVYWLFTYIQMAIIGDHVDWFAGFNIVCNIIVAYELFYICRKLSKSRLLPFLSSLCYLASRFAYYQIGQALGLMETLAQFFALWILYLLFVYMNKPNDRTEAELISRGESRLSELIASASKGAGQLLSALSGGRKEGAEKDAENGEGEDLPRKLDLHLSLVRSYDIYFHGALILYVLLCFTHERYLCLLPLFYLVLLVKWLREKKDHRRAYLKENRRLWLSPVICFALIMLIRTISTGAFVPAGTGGTEVTDTFSIAGAIGFAIDEVLYIFGVNAGDAYLSGLSWADTPVMIKALVKLSVLMLAVICCMYLITLLLKLSSKDAEGRKDFWRLFSDSALIAGFIGLCIAASSVTIRVEMRWVYVSYSAALIFACYMISAIKDAYATTFIDAAAETNVGESNAVRTAAGHPEDPSEPENADSTDDKKSSGTLTSDEASQGILTRISLSVADRLLGPKVFYGILCLLFTAYCGLSIYTNNFYRGYFGNIYFWPDQLRMNSLAEQTIEKYGTDEVLGKDVYIIGNSYGMSDFYARTFFKPFDKEKTGQGTRIYFVSDPEIISETALSSGNIIILREVPEENAYLDITDELTMPES